MGFLGFPGGSDGKESACNAGGPGVRSLHQEDPLEKGMATNSTVFAWEIPWTEEPSRLQSMWVTKSQTRLSDSHFPGTNRYSKSDWGEEGKLVLL